MSWTNYSEPAKTRPAFPKAGEHDTFKVDALPTADTCYPGKLLIKTVQREISVFKTQILPVARYFTEHPNAKTAQVDWISEEHTNQEGKKVNWTVAVVRTKL